jgi:hypothetical protein
MASLANPEPTIRFDPTNVRYVCFRRKGDVNGKVGFESNGNRVLITNIMDAGAIKPICVPILKDDDWNVHCKIDDNFTEEDLDKYDVIGYSREYIINDIMPIFKPNEYILKLINQSSKSELVYLIGQIMIKFRYPEKKKETILSYLKVLGFNNTEIEENTLEPKIMKIIILHLKKEELLSELVYMIIEKSVDEIAKKTEEESQKHT